MAQTFTIAEDGTVVINKIALTNTSGNVTHDGFLRVTGNTQVDSNLVVTGTITADTFNVKHLVTENGSLGGVGQWAYTTEEELIGKGFTWTWGNGSTQLIYRLGNKLWTGANLDLAKTSSYLIDGIPVLTSTHLGSTITTSNLTTIGTLSELEVSGSANIADFVFFDSISNRIGVGTDEPSSSLTILDNNVEIGIGSPRIGLGAIGTHSSHDLAIATDNLPRITVKATGEVNIGDEVSGGGVLNVYGTIYAHNIQSDSRIDRVFPLQFNATTDTSIYGLGLQWSGTGITRQFVMMAGPDRLWSTESIDLASNQCYYLNGKVAIADGQLGRSILNSSLQTVGVLTSLEVAGTTQLSTITAQSLTTSDNTNSITISAVGIVSTHGVNITAGGKDVFTSNSTQITVGDVTNQTRPVKVFGPLSVNINNPDPAVQFSVNGDVSIGGKKFTNGVTYPTTGMYQVGDMCWNTKPVPGGYVGWICILAGTPGTWVPFGAIASQ